MIASTGVGLIVTGTISSGNSSFPRPSDSTGSEALFDPETLALKWICRKRTAPGTAAVHLSPVWTRTVQPEPARRVPDRKLIGLAGGGVGQGGDGRCVQGIRSMLSDESAERGPGPTSRKSRSGTERNSSIPVEKRTG